MVILPEIIVYAAAGVGAAMAYGQTQLNAWYKETVGDDDDPPADGGDEYDADGVYSIDYGLD